MARALRRHVTYENVMATVAAFLVLGVGTAFAAYVVSSNSQLGPNTVSGHRPPPGDHANIIAGSVSSTDLADGVVTAAKLAPSEAYRRVGGNGQPDFQNGWSDFPAGLALEDAAFYKDPFGIVHLKGAIMGGANGTTAFTLPAGYKPASTQLLPGANGGTTASFVRILSTGEVQPTCAGGDCGFSVNLDGLTFRP